MSRRSVGLRRFERLFREHASFVWSAAVACGAPPDAVDDVVQDVFVVAHRRRDEVDWDRSPRGWLYGVTRRVVFRYRRSAARRARKGVALADVQPASTDEREAREASNVLRAALRTLSPKQRRLLTMSELLGLSGPEMADALGIPLNTVYSRVRTLRQRLEAIVREQGGELDSELARARAGARPSRRRIARGWAVLLPRLLDSSTVGATGAAKVTAGWWALGTTLVAVGVVVAVGTGRPAPAATGTAAVAHGEPAPADRSIAAGGQRPASAAEPPGVAEPARPAPPVGGVEPPEAAAATRGAEHRKPRPSRRPRASTPTEPADEAADAPPPPSPGGIEEELALLSRARAAIERRRFAAAASALDEHARRFPQSTLGDVRGVTRVDLLCATGRGEQARAQLEQLRREWSGSSVVRAAQCE